MIIRYLSLILLCLAAFAAPAATTDARDPYTYFFNLSTGDLKSDLADAKTGGRKAVFVMFEQEGCPGCAFMKENVLNRPDVQKFYRDNFVNLSLDIYGSVLVTDFAGRTSTEKGYAQASRVKGTPTLVFYDLSGNEVVRLLGAVKDAREFMLLGEFVASGAYKSRKFAEYKQDLLRKKGS
ncbi:MAG TPA: thioredoxin family protein [Pseudolabrys sp.]|nr:thioredoxin family protein [Pseudolabrys sp.]